MLLSYRINLVKLEMLSLSKILAMTYNLGWREYNRTPPTFSFHHVSCLVVLHLILSIRLPCIHVTMWVLLSMLAYNNAHIHPREH